MSDSPGKFTLYDLRITVAEIRGRSVCGMKVGDYFEVRNSSQVTIPPGQHFCLYAMSAVMPLLAGKAKRAVGKRLVGLGQSGGLSRP